MNTDRRKHTDLGLASSRGRGLGSIIAGTTWRENSIGAHQIQVHAVAGTKRPGSTRERDRA